MSEHTDNPNDITRNPSGLPQPLRSHKDRLFRMLFKGKAEFLELYNALNGTSYTDTEDMTVATLDNAVYLSMKNDVAYLLYDRLSLYEHQSTPNPNMPLRNLLYVANTYSGLTADDDLFGTKLVQIPEPVFIVFYNGETPMPECWVRKLSDMFFTKSEEPALELKMLVLNINPGYNEALKQNCRTLWGYMEFVSRIRRYRKTESLAQAVDMAISECIREGILADFFRKNRNEVRTMSIFEYDEEKHIRSERAYARELGREEGREEGRKEEHEKTERERQRADVAEQKVSVLEQQLERLRKELEQLKTK